MKRQVGLAHQNAVAGKLYQPDHNQLLPDPF